MAELRLPEAVRPRPPGTFARLRSAPLAASFGLLVVLVAGYLGVLAVAGRLADFADPEASVELARSSYFSLVLATLIAFTTWARLSEPPSVAADLAALRSQVELAPEAFDASVRRAFAGRLAVRLGLVGGAVLGTGIAVGSERLSNGGFSGWGWGVTQWWALASTIGLFCLLGLNAAASFQAMRVFNELGRHARVRLLAPEPLRVFGRRGLRWSSFWFVGSALALLLVMTADRPGLVLAVILATVAMGVASLLLPSLGVHERLLAAKREELARVRAAIERRSGALLDGQRAEDDPDLPALLAYEARIERAAEWPFDAPLLARFGLLVLIPVLSWVGGALVERVVDTLLD